MNVYMAIKFGGEVHDLCCELGLVFGSTQLATQVFDFFGIEYLRYDVNENKP